MNIADCEDPMQDDFIFERMDSTELVSFECPLEREASDVSVSVKLPVINEAMQLIGSSPIPKKRLLETERNDNWRSNKWQRVSENLKQTLGVKNSNIDRDRDDFNEMIQGFIEKFHHPSTPYEMKIQILTTLPKNWSICGIASKMHATFHMAKVAKQVREKAGVLALPQQKIGIFSTVIFISFNIPRFNYCKVILFACDIFGCNIISV